MAPRVSLLRGASNAMLPCESQWRNRGLHGLGIPHRWWCRAVPLLFLLLVAVIVRAAGVPADSVNSPVRAILAGERPGPPPLTRLLVDMSIANTGGVPLWALIPANLPPPTDTTGGVNHLEQRTATTGGSRVAVARLLGRAGCYALLLAPGARVTLRQLEIGWWREPPANPSDIAFEVRLTGAVTIGGHPLAGWFDGEPTITGTTEIDMRAAPHTHSRAAPRGIELPLVASEVVPVVVRLASP